ncbi:MAG: hypothetical protein L0L50_07750, partial [Propionibacterium sp.]|nr:hypothetical protein [Propionibacterium sp.]
MGMLGAGVALATAVGRCGGIIGASGRGLTGGGLVDGGLVGVLGDGCLLLRIGLVRRLLRPGCLVNDFLVVGGCLLWVELPQRVNALEVHRRALALGIGVSPGPLFSPAAELT